ncbi:hypothetical protein [Devosia sp. Root436]|uniref:hypothetical protein n=1 Tax=Devosia sp. Root436 TaxID=1736537 RepID=UPI000AF43207|nr:hypothetical protein [Devosia sp. Root436]
MDEKSLSEVELIEQAAKRMAKRLSLTYVTDPNKRSTFEASQSGSYARYGYPPGSVETTGRKRA